MNWLRNYLGTVVAVLLITAGAFAGPITEDIKKEVAAVIAQRLEKTAFVPGTDFGKWPSILEKHQAKIDKAATEDEFAQAMNEALAEFGTSHLGVMTPTQKEARAKGSSAGIGIYPEVTPDGVMVRDIVPDGPAAKAGVAAGDLITEVNGIKPTAITVFQGEIGTKFTLTLKDGDGKVRKVEVVRAVFPTTIPESLTWLPGDTALLRIPSFETYDNSNVLKLMEELTPRAKYVIIDLRGNPGGYVFKMQQFAGLFMPEPKPMGTMINRSLVNDFKKEFPDTKELDLKKLSDWSKYKLNAIAPKGIKPYGGKLAVLINAGSGSAAEIMSAAFQETRGAEVFGQKSAGMVLAAIMSELPSNFILMLPIQDYITAKGVRLEGHGVTPNVMTPIKAPKDKEDLTVQAALKWLTSTTPAGSN